MREREFYLPSSDGMHQLRCMEWIPDGTIKAVLQITHGMVEHIERYREFCVWMAERGIVVIGHDHLGHGKTVSNREEFGYFGSKEGMTHVVKDIRRVTVYSKKKYPDQKLILLGHSMGSFLARKYLSVYKDGPDGFILMGTGAPPEALVSAGSLLAGSMRKLKGEMYRSPLLYKLSLGNYNAKFKPVKTPYDWLTRDESLSKDFGEDESCQFIFTTAAYQDFFRLILNVAKEEMAGHARTDAPILIISGDNDPVGDNGKGVRKVYERLHKAGVDRLEMVLYEGARHEILHEINRQEVFEDLYEWIAENC
ncbi:MAG: alpha/beta hydrolase [Lachnospiraceae bacterium]|nr:alpha/beta hydrolase [Lachnospiraceae bacterium]MBQ2425935.1 alpha/beta hydrolase [Lachnospiraceae bacterium]MBQ5806651.1 alpha/beta hydrolase [Lachnospiraceae bacterium]